MGVIDCIKTPLYCISRYFGLQMSENRQKASPFHNNAQKKALKLLKLMPIQSVKDFVSHLP